MKSGRVVLAGAAVFVAGFILAVLVLTMLGQPTPLSPNP